MQLQKVQFNPSKWSRRTSIICALVAALLTATALLVVLFTRAASTTYTLWDSETPASIDTNTRSVELGTKFTVSTAGTVDAIRFYKAETNTGQHTGSIWDYATGARLASVTFTTETAKGWQSAKLSTPLGITPGKVYVVSYFAPNGNYSYDTNYFTTARTKGPLTALKNTSTSRNGTYVYSTTSAFPAKGSSTARNYWVDVSFTVNTVDPPGPTTTSLWTNETPQLVDPNPRPVELATKFTVASPGKITAIRFYKNAANTGQHTGSIWDTATQARLATVTFKNETASGWQSATLDSALVVRPGVVYAVSYFAPQGNYSYDLQYFTSPRTSGRITALGGTPDSRNGAYAYGETSTFPAQESSSARNYWVDIAYVPDTTGPPPPPPPATSYDTTILGDNPVAYWAMDRAGAPEPDLTERGKTGTYLGGAPQLVDMINGDKAAKFNGINQYMTVASHPSLSPSTTGKFTWEAWIRPDNLQPPSLSSGGYVDWMGKCHVYSPSCEWQGRMYATTNPQGRCNRISGYIFNPTAGLGSAADWQPTCGLFKPGQWLHVVAHYQTETTPERCDATYPGSAEIWVNGIKWNHKTHGTTGCMSQYKVKPVAGNSPFTVGTMAKGTWFLGAIGKVAIYDKLLTQAQITEHFTAMTGVAPSGVCNDSCTTLPADR